jgi:rod shape-determining protein MreC
MQRLFQFFYEYRAFLFFVFLETISGWLIVQNNNYQSSAFFNSSNYYAASILEIQNNIREYFSLRDVNEQLAQENSRLNYLLTIEQQKKSQSADTNSLYLRTHQYKFVPAKVINASMRRSQNFLTINKGLADGIKPQMGVISPLGAVGKVKACSQNFSTVVSLLTQNIYIASKIKSKEIQCSVTWDGKDPRRATVLNVPIHHKVQKGDTVVTSEENRIYPEGVLLGIVESAKINERAEYEINIILSTDFSTLSYVYVIENKLKDEADSLEQTNTPRKQR